MAMAFPRASPPRSQLPAETSRPSAAQRSVSFPTMPDIIAASREQGLRLRLQVLGPFFRVLAEGEDGSELGRAEGVVRPWVAGKVLHLDSMRLSRETLSMDRSIFGLGLFVGAAAVRHGYDQGCRTAQLLAINDSPLFHSKLVRFYTRMGFKVVHEVDGSSVGDLAHMLVWGGRGTRMDAEIEQLFVQWGKKIQGFKFIRQPSHRSQTSTCNRQKQSLSVLPVVAIACSKPVTAKYEDSFDKQNRVEAKTRTERGVGNELQVQTCLM